MHAEHEHITLIGEYCVVGHGAIVHGCTIGAGTLLTEGKSFPSGSLILGSPGKAVRELNSDEIAHIQAAAKSYWDKAVSHQK